MAYPLLVNIEVPSPLQLIPSAEYAIVLVPFPTAIHNLPLYATELPAVENMDVELVAADHVIPSPE